MTTKELQLRAGEQLACATCTTRVVVVSAPGDAAVEIICGDTALQPAAAVTSPPKDGAEPATVIGKRYVNAEETVELLCTSSGSGALMCGGSAMTLKSAKALPASD